MFYENSPVHRAPAAKSAAMLLRVVAAAALTLLPLCSGGTSATAEAMAAAKARAAEAAVGGDAAALAHAEESVALHGLWANIEREFGVGAVKKMLTSQRAMLAALDDFRADYAGSTGGGGGGSAGGFAADKLEAKRLAAEALRTMGGEVDDELMEAWSGKEDSAYASPQARARARARGGEATPEEAARQRWAKSHNAAAYAGLTPPAPPTLPLRVDLVFVGADGSGHEGLELDTDDLRAWFGHLQAKVPLATVAMEMDNHHTPGQHGGSDGSSGTGALKHDVVPREAAAGDVAQFDVAYRVVKVSPQVTDAVTALLEKKVIRWVPFIKNIKF